MSLSTPLTQTNPAVRPNHCKDGTPVLPYSISNRNYLLPIPIISSILSISPIAIFKITVSGTIVAIVLMVTGFLFAFFGHKFFKITLFLAGFYTLSKLIISIIGKGVGFLSVSGARRDVALPSVPRAGPNHRKKTKVCLCQSR